MKQILKLGGILALYATVACVGLAFVYLLTKPVIQKHEEEKLAQNLRIVFPEGNRFEEVSEDFVSQFANKTGSTKLEKAYKVFSEENAFLGLIVQATGPTYAESTVLVAITDDSVIKNLRVTKTSDTSGLGSKSTLPSFYEQFSGKSAKGPFQAKNGIDVISGATITTNGIGKIVTGICDSAIEYIKTIDISQPKNEVPQDSSIDLTETESTETQHTEATEIQSEEKINE